MSAIKREVTTSLVHISSELVHGNSSSLGAKAAIEGTMLRVDAPGINEPLSENFAKEIVLSVIERASVMFKVKAFLWRSRILSLVLLPYFHEVLW